MPASAVEHLEQKQCIAQSPAFLRSAVVTKFLSYQSAAHALFNPVSLISTIETPSKRSKSGFNVAKAVTEIVSPDEIIQPPMEPQKHPFVNNVVPELLVNLKKLIWVSQCDNGAFCHDVVGDSVLIRALINGPNGSPALARLVGHRD
ncbi:uncharacterized protein FOMMEDRAFT_151608 [Fomitiporia mediterranea MF3/22]|uniref:uncharacterized protein n=1 Tax=Fomitiporia mediterranea (strain MF3/22) TaxID=694068 RepID=UPI00044094E5|nr:uncharacterized protein FOMMEDRAFT_151608 [Fomitiporia mediterranea MF3/22]EJD06368.1 hypothetical protein FOMMEDRAFT_151608 [Fomitiporia mediterranea MF3/22]